MNRCEDQNVVRANLNGKCEFQNTVIGENSNPFDARLKVKKCKRDGKKATSLFLAVFKQMNLVANESYRYRN